jgi:two-component system invasion response regulator UvrY
MVTDETPNREGADIVNDDVSSSALPTQITVMVVDDSRELVDALVGVLQSDPRFTVVGTAFAPDEVDEPARALPQLATVDVRMPGGGGFEATRRILRISPTTRVVALSAFSTASLQQRMRDAGAVAYLTKGMMGEDLLDQLVAIAGSGTSDDG